MFSFDKDIIFIALIIALFAGFYYLHKEMKSQKSNIDQCKMFSIELADHVFKSSSPAPAEESQVESAEKKVE